MVNSGINWTGVQFIKSSHSGTDQGNCVEIGVTADTVGIRDSKRGQTGPVLEINEAAFRTFMASAKTDTFAKSV